MKLTKRFARVCLAFAKDQPGSRFMNLATRIQGLGPRPLVWIIGVGAGVVLMLFGFFLGLIPGIPGFVLGLLGMALIAAQFPSLARMFDTLELSIRRGLRKLRGEKARSEAGDSEKLAPLAAKIKTSPRHGNS
jgi:hypothetical protein